MPSISDRSSKASFLIPKPLDSPSFNRQIDAVVSYSQTEFGFGKQSAHARPNWHMSTYIHTYLGMLLATVELRVAPVNV